MHRNILRQLTSYREVSWLLLLLELELSGLLETKFFDAGFAATFSFPSSSRTWSAIWRSLHTGCVSKNRTSSWANVSYVTILWFLLWTLKNPKRIIWAPKVFKRKRDFFLFFFKFLCVKRTSQFDPECERFETSNWSEKYLMMKLHERLGSGLNFSGRTGHSHYDYCLSLFKKRPFTASVQWTMNMFWPLCINKLRRRASVEKQGCFFKHQSIKTLKATTV